MLLISTSFQIYLFNIVFFMRLGFQTFRFTQWILILLKYFELVFPLQLVEIVCKLMVIWLNCWIVVEKWGAFFSWNTAYMLHAKSWYIRPYTIVKKAAWLPVHQSGKQWISGQLKTFIEPHVARESKAHKTKTDCSRSLDKASISSAFVRPFKHAAMRVLLSVSLSVCLFVRPARAPSLTREQKGVKSNAFAVNATWYHAERQLKMHSERQKWN